MAALNCFFRKGFLFFLSSTLTLFFLAGSGMAQSTLPAPYLVKDINPGSGDSGPRNFISQRKTIYFSATEQAGFNLIISFTGRQVGDHPPVGSGKGIFAQLRRSHPAVVHHPYLLNGGLSGDGKKRGAG